MNTVTKVDRVRRRLLGTDLFKEGGEGVTYDLELIQ